jgi:hypothetical protein
MTPIISSLLNRANHVKVEAPMALPPPPPPLHIALNSPIPNLYSNKKCALKIFKIDKKKYCKAINEVYHSNAYVIKKEFL